MNEQVEKWDLFISHASEDKKSLVEPLADALQRFGVQVWYDKFALKVGDSLSRSIDRGLAKSDYGLVVISPAFIAKSWPEYELRGLTAKEIAGGRKVILPIWHMVTTEQVLAFSPPLADKLALPTEGATPIQLAAEIIKAVRPDIFARLHRRKQFLEMLDDAAVVRAPPTRLRAAPIQHQTLPAELVGRIRLIRASVLDVFPQSMAYWLEGFMRDAHPSAEVQVWEHIAAGLREYVAMHPELSPRDKKSAFDTLLALDFRDAARARKFSRTLPAGALGKLRTIYSSPQPTYEIAEARRFTEETERVKASNLRVRAVRLPPSESAPRPADKEHFPNDLPEEIVRDYMKHGATASRSRKRRPPKASKSR